MADVGGYFASESPRTTGLPAELIIARIVLLGVAATVVITILWGALLQGGTADWIGQTVGTNAASIIGGLLALFIRRGWRWVRWLITGVGVIWCIPVVLYTVSESVSYIGKGVVPAVLITTMHLPAARRYFAKEA